MAAGCIVNDSLHYLDHLAPFCALKKWPLILCEPLLADLARAYYPDLSVIQQSWSDLHLPSPIVSCHPRPFLDTCFLKGLDETLWLPHGNSDKGWKSELFEHLRHEKRILVYGSKMIDAIQEKTGSLSHVPIETVGNFRAKYFVQHIDFYRPLIQKLFPKKPGSRTFLYAPTWKDFEDSCSFWQAFPILARHLPGDCTLLVKLHPNTESAHIAEIEQCIGRYQSKPNIIWIRDFPPIYPLLDISDAYIGDMSSIGYDFLFQNRPMYFLNSQKRDVQKDPGLYLYRCGTQLLPEEYSQIFTIDKETRDQDKERFGKMRQAVYEYTFSCLVK